MRQSQSPAQQQKEQKLLAGLKSQLEATTLEEDALPSPAELLSPDFATEMEDSDLEENDSGGLQPLTPSEKEDLLEACGSDEEELYPPPEDVISFADMACSEVTKVRMRSLIAEFQDVFAKHPLDCGLLTRQADGKPYTVSFQLDNPSQVIHQPSYRMPASKLALVPSSRTTTPATRHTRDRSIPLLQSHHPHQARRRQTSPSRRRPPRHQRRIQTLRPAGTHPPHGHLPLRGRPPASPGYPPWT